MLNRYFDLVARTTEIIRNCATIDCFSSTIKDLILNAKRKNYYYAKYSK